MIADKVNVPKTHSGELRRIRADQWAEISGMRYCTSCQRSKPADQVKVYRAVNAKSNVGIPRCDSCQEIRLKALRARKKG